MVSREDSEAEQEDVDGEDQGSGAFTPKIDELENLLEAYFVQIDGTLNKLFTVRMFSLFDGYSSWRNGMKN